MVAISRAITAEAEYISEWLDYHLVVGFDKFIILNNDATGRVTEILRPYVEQGAVEEIHREVVVGSGDEFPGFRDTVKQLHGETFWFSWVDLDEFWVPPSWAEHLRDATMPFTNMRTAWAPKAFHGHWLYFGESPWAQQRPAPGTPVALAFTRRQLETHPKAKQLSLIDAVDFDSPPEDWSMHSIALRYPYGRSAYNIIIGPLILWWEVNQDIAILTRVSFCSQNGSVCLGTTLRDIVVVLSLLLLLRSATAGVGLQLPSSVQLARRDSRGLSVLRNATQYGRSVEENEDDEAERESEEATSLVRHISPDPDMSGSC